MKQRTKLLLARIFLAAMLFFGVLLIILAFGTNGALKYLNYFFDDTTQCVLTISTAIISLISFILFIGFVMQVGGTTKELKGWGRIRIIVYPPSQTFANPTLSTQVLCPFSCICEKHYENGHVGIDIAPQTPNMEGAPVYAVIKGKIYIDKERGIARIESKMFDIIYRCLKTIECKDGAKVKKGDHIGTMGGADTEYGVHLHMEIWNNIDHVFVDPFVFYDWNQTKNEERV